MFCFSQQKAVSPFSIEDYKRLRTEFLQEAAEDKDQLLFLKGYYYSTKKLDSVLLIKDQFKRKYLLENGKKLEEITEKDLASVNDDIVLPFAIFKIKAKNYSFTLLIKIMLHKFL